MGFFKDFFMGTDATPAEHGIDVQYIDDYADYAGIRKGLIDYWQGALQGDVPEWLTKYSDELLRGNMRGINEDYLGLPGDRSNSQLGLAGQVDASRGTGKATTTNRTIQQMMSKKSAAREASAGYRLGSMGQIVSEANKGMLELPQGQRYASSRFTTPGDPGTPRRVSPCRPRQGRTPSIDRR